MDDNFSPRVKDVIAHSKEEALRLGHEYIDTQHLGAVVELDYEYWIGNDKSNTRTVMLFEISNNRIYKIMMPWRIR